MPWIRFWCDILNSEKVADLDDEAYRVWTYCLIAAKLHEQDGKLPPFKRLAYWLRMPERQLEAVMKTLEDAGLLDRTPDGHRAHDWEHWQSPKDGTAAERMKRHRQKKGSCTSKENTDTEQTREGTGVTPVTPVTRNARNVTEIPPPSRIGLLAEELMGDVSWRIWADQQVTLGHPDSAIEEALRACVNASKIDRRYAAGVLKRLAQDGYPVSRSKASMPPVEYVRAPKDWNGPKP